MQPQKLGRYEILEELGRGAMGRVFLAYDPQIDRRVAIKILQEFEPENDEARNRFLAEARSAGKLLHPGIVTLFDAGEADGRLYLAMEHVVGQTVDRFCAKEARLPVDQVVNLVAGAGEALAFAHRNGVIHRDIKPANLMRGADGRVKIMDFGLAGGAEAGRAPDGALIGSPSYMSPEQIRGESVDGRSDLFSLGVVLFELLTGEKPFAGDSVSSIIYRIVHEQARDVTAIEGRCSPELESFLRRALAKPPDERFSDGDEFARALREIGVPDAPPLGPAIAPASSETGIPDEIPATEKAPPRQSSAMPFILGIVFLLAAAGAGAYYFRDELGFFQPAPPEELLLETSVRAVPPEATLSLDGEPIDPSAGGLVRFGSQGPFAVLTATLECRSEEHRLDPADAGGEVALILEPTNLSHRLEDATISTRVSLNGEPMGSTPLDLEFDLCRENRLVLVADGYRESTVEIPQGATPLEARTLLGAIELQPIPLGTLALSEAAIPLTYFVDGARVQGKSPEIELPEGSHKVRAINERFWIDVTESVRVIAAETVRPELKLPDLTTLVVLAYPPNCRVDVRRPGGKWKYLDEVPLRRRLATGRYEVRVTLKPTGEAQTREVDLVAGENPELRIAFGD